LFFFFQAEDGIRDRNVTGVQTCALPISLGLEHSRTRNLATTRVLAGRHSTTTQVAMRTRPTVLMRSLTTKPAASTRPTVLPRSITTPPATSTRPPVLMRSRPTRPAIKTSHWASPPVRISPRAITISILATEVLGRRPTPFVLAMQPTQEPLLPALVGQTLERA